MEDRGTDGAVKWGDPETYLLGDRHGHASTNSASMEPGVPESEKASPAPAQKVTPLLVLVTFLSGLGGFLFGYDTGVISGALLLLKSEFNLSVPWQEGIVSSTTAAAWLFALVGGIWTIGALGRRATIMVASVVFIVGSVILAAAPEEGTILAGRLVVGAAIGLASVTVPVYIAECSPPFIRGTLLFVFQINITVGMFLSIVISGLFSYDRHSGWRYMFGLAALPGLAQLLGVIVLPNSPRWLVSKGRNDQARATLRRLRGTQEVEKELSTITTAHTLEQEAARGKGCVSLFLQMMGDWPVRKALFVGCGLQMFQQIIGINTVLYYSATIIRMAGFTNDSEAIWWAAATAAVNVAFTFVGIYLVDRIGRRLLLLISLCGVLLCLLLLAAGFLITDNTSPPVTHDAPVTYSTNYTQSLQCSSYTRCTYCVNDPQCGFCYTTLPAGPANGSCLIASPEDGKPYPGLSGDLSCDADTTRIWTYDICPGPYAWVIVLAMALYLVFYSIGMGPIPWVINSEIYPLWARGTGCALATATNWAFNLLVSMTFLSLADAITKPGVFFVYSGLTFLSIVFTYICVPETKGQTLEDVQQLFDTRWGYQQL